MSVRRARKQDQQCGGWTRADATHQCPRQEVDRERVRVREQLRERFPFPEGQRANVITRPPRRDRVELIQRRRPEDIEDERQLMVVVAPGEQRLSGQHLRKDAADRPYIDRLNPDGNNVQC